MVIIRKGYINPISTIQLWLIPTLTYLWFKFFVKVTFHNEWVWWVIIPIAFISWFLMSFKFVKKITFDHDAVFNVQRFNEWWNNKDNGATYAHSGIYLRLDKISLSHVTEYLYKVHGLSLSEHYTYDEANDFYVEISNNWYEQLHSV